MIPVALLVRVSTDRQDTARQTAELTSVAAAKGWQVVEVVEEAGISGRRDRGDRPGLARVEVLAESGAIKKVLVHEISRLTRRPSVAHSFVEALEGYGVSLYWHAQSIETLLPSGKRNPAAAIMLALMAEMARAETDTLRERVKSGLEQARRAGKVLGRPKGSGATREAFLVKHGAIVKLLEAGHSQRHVSKITGKGTTTVLQVAKAMRGGVA